LLPKILTKLVCQKQPKAVQPAKPTSQSCQKTNFKKTYINADTLIDMYFSSLWKRSRTAQVLLACLRPLFLRNLCWHPSNQRNYFKNALKFEKCHQYQRSKNSPRQTLLFTMFPTHIEFWWNLTHHVLIK